MTLARQELPGSVYNVIKSRRDGCGSYSFYPFGMKTYLLNASPAVPAGLGSFSPLRGRYWPEHPRLTASIPSGYY